MELIKKDMDKLLSRYDLGTFRKFGKVMKDDGTSYGQIIYTNKEKIFMKTLHWFGTTVRQGIEVQGLLYNKGYPTHKIYQTKNKKNCIKYKGKNIVLLEYLNIGPQNIWKELNLEQIKDYAKNLALFHKMTKNMKLKSTKQGGFSDIRNLIYKAYKVRDRYDAKTQTAIKFMQKNIGKLECKSDGKKSGFYSEFNPGHVFFKGNKVQYVIDWEIGRNFRYYDWGGSLIACFDGKEKSLSMKKVRAFINAYDSIQKLSKWEKNHIYEGIIFGVIKYGIWGLMDPEIGGLVRNSSGIDKGDVKRVLNMMKIDKEKFYKNLKEKPL